MPTRFRGIAGRFALVVLGLAGGLALTEAGLQVASVAYRHWVGDRSHAAAPRLIGATRVVCIGDSNTFGIWVEPGQTYPARLARLLDEGAGPGRFEIINLGVPGAPSGTFSRQIREIIDSFEPDLVVAMLGVNNILRDPIEAEPARQRQVSPLLRFVQQHSRLYALFRLVSRSRMLAANSDRVDLTVDGGEANARMTVGDDAKLEFQTVARKKNLTERRKARAQIVEDIATIDEAARERGARLVLMTYANNDTLYGETNPLLRQIAADRGLPLVDNAAQTPQRDEFFFSDGHPNAAGYERIAHNLAAFLLGRPAATPAPPP